MAGKSYGKPDGAQEDENSLDFVLWKYYRAKGSSTEVRTLALAYVIDATSLALFTGATDKVNLVRRNAMSSRVRNAATALARADTSAAVSLLESVLGDFDGQADGWMKHSATRDALVKSLEELIEALRK